MSRDSTDLLESLEERNRRLDALLASMVVEEGLAVLQGREPHQYSLDQIADFTGVSNDTIQRIEAKALRKLHLKMVR